MTPARQPLLRTYRPSDHDALVSVLSREEREEVMRAVRQLPDRQREALASRSCVMLASGVP